MQVEGHLSKDRFIILRKSSAIGDIIYLKNRYEYYLNLVKSWNVILIKINNTAIRKLSNM